MVALILSGQTSKGTIAGTVLDSSGAAVANAVVQVIDTTGAEKISVQTGDSGQYRVEAVTPSIYKVTVTAPGFSVKEVNGLAVHASVVTSLNISIEVGATGQTISVEASAEQLQTATGDLSQTISTVEIAKLPINSLNPIDLVLTEPGVNAVENRDAFTNGSGFSVNGLRPRANNFLIDGFDNNDQGIAGQALQPTNLEAVKEVSLLENSYAPEFGRGGASVTNVIYKNGTNQYRGSLWERYTGSGLNALTSEEKRSGLLSKPRTVSNTFGFAVGGPIVKNKLFLFGSSQWARLFGSETGNPLILPTAQGVANLNTIASSAPNAALLVTSLGGLAAASASSNINVGNRSGCGSPCLIPVGTFLRTPTQQSLAYEYIIRGDYMASEKNTISARFIGTQSSLTPDLFANPNALPTQDSFQGGPARNLGVYWTHILGPATVNEARFTSQQIHFIFGPLDSTASSPLYGLPNITISEFTASSFGGPLSAVPQGRGHDTYEYQDAFSWSLRTHSFKVGADVTHLLIDDLIAFNGRGLNNFTSGGDCSTIGLSECTGLANFLDNFTGPSGTAGKQFGNSNLSFSQTTQSYYLEDTWKLQPSLTATYGIRYEYFGTPLNALPYPAINARTVLSDPLQTRVRQEGDKNNWAPRAGIAWNPGAGKTVLRAGGGVFYDTLFTNILDNVASTAPNTLGGTLSAPASGRGTPGALGLVAGVTPTLNPLAAVSVADSRLVSPLTYQWNFNVQQRLPWSFLGTVAYVGTRGERLFLTQELNPGVNGVRVNPARGSIGARLNVGDSIYYGLQTNLTRRFSGGLLLKLAYTYSKAIDNGSEVFANVGGSAYAQDVSNLRAERGVSAFDRTHRTAITWLYTVPYRSSGNGWRVPLRELMRNWTLSGTAQLQSGAPDTIYFNGLDENRDLRSSSDRPDLANPGVPLNLSEACVNSSTCITGIGRLRADGTYVDANTGAPGAVNQFRYVSSLGRPGNLGRNTFRNDWTQDYTIAVERNFPIPHLEHQQLEFRLEAINPFNHPNPGLVSTNLLDPVFLNKDIAYSGGRTVNLWLKYRF